MTQDLLPNEKAAPPSQNSQLAWAVFHAVKNKGVKEFCLCPGSRNSPLVDCILEDRSVTPHFWFEERSAAFFALGRARATQSPVAIVVTSGSAAGQLLPAAMEAYYSQVPLLLITADRPRRFRGTGAPQTAEQLNLFGCYTPFSIDIDFSDLSCSSDRSCFLDRWDCKNAAHLNACFEEPQTLMRPGASTWSPPLDFSANSPSSLDYFLQSSHRPLVIVSTLSDEAREPIIKFLKDLNAPVYLEATSGLRENSDLSHLRISRTEQIWQESKKWDYSIDGILRIGGVPTLRLWRDLEDKAQEIAVCSISEAPFSGLSWKREIICTNLKDYFETYLALRSYSPSISSAWRMADRAYQEQLQRLFEEEPYAEASLIHQLSQVIAENSLIYLGNSLPIREWDLAAQNGNRLFKVRASRGINGIDGQLSTFFGFSEEGRENWAILGDLTTLYDLAGPWIIPQLSNRPLRIVVINNSGGQFFARLFDRKECLHSHQLSFKSFAELWGLQYEQWQKIPNKLALKKHVLIEIIPDNEASKRFWKKVAVTTKT